MNNSSSAFGNKKGPITSNIENILYDKFGGENLNRILFVFGVNNFGDVEAKTKKDNYSELLRFLMGFRISTKGLINSLQRHTFHIVTPSPWPIYAALSAFVLLVSSAAYMHRYEGGGSGILLGFFLIIFSMFVWWRDVIRESTWQGYHTYNVQKGLRLGFALFIVSEVMFFFSIFWAFFHSSLSPAIELGSIWPPVGLEILDPWKIPALNTLILLMSGVTITLAHHGIIGKSGITHFGFLATVVLAVFFTALQVFEYITASFDIADGVYGTTFFFSTGFHGFHVFIGTCFIFVCWIRYALGHFTATHHIGFESAAWYWHFVDVVWLFLFISIYWWGSF